LKNRFTVKRPGLKQTQAVLCLFEQKYLKKLSGSVPTALSRHGRMVSDFSE